MSQHDLEYAIAVFQKGIFTFAAKEHRKMGGNPTLTITLKGTYVEWIISPLTQGIPDTNDKDPQKDRFDMYFLLEDVCKTVKSWPNALVAPALWGKANNNQGTERAGGRTIKMDTPIGRLSGITSLIAQVGIGTGAPFTSSANNLTLFVDIEHTPKGKLYTSEVFQLHIGFKGDYVYKSGVTAITNQVTIEMPNEVYEAIRLQLNSLCK